MILIKNNDELFEKYCKIKFLLKILIFLLIIILYFLNKYKYLKNKFELKLRNF